MGRAEKSQGLAPPAIRKDMRAKQARHTINKTIPALLASNARARKGSEISELIVDPQPVALTSRSGEHAAGGEKEEREDEMAYVKRKGQGRRKAKAAGDDETIVRAGHEKDGKGKSKARKRQDSLDKQFSNLSVPSPGQTSTSSPQEQSHLNIHTRIITTDTLTAAHILTFPHQYQSPTSSHASTKPLKKSPNTCILNMASPLRPGGGVLAGATSQEEFLCARTTLLPSLKDSYYRLPERGGIFTPDVLVFRNAEGLGNASGELGPTQRYWIDVISAGMLRFPELEVEVVQRPAANEEDDKEEEIEIKNLSKKDRETVDAKMRAVLRIAISKGVQKLVLGAWGCGAYGNPVGDIARAWRKVIYGNTSTAGMTTKKGKVSSAAEQWPTLQQIVFAISNEKMARQFAAAFDSDIVVEAGPGGSPSAEDDEDEEEDQVAQELRTKIQEMEGQLSKVWNPDLKARMGVILEGLRAQLREREGEGAREDEQEDDSDGDGDGSDMNENEDQVYPSDGSESVDGDYDSSEDAVAVSSKTGVIR